MTRETWTDERLDDLKASVDAGFRDNREEFRALRTEIREVSQSVDRITWSLMGMMAIMFVGFLGVVATIVTQT